MIRNTNDIVLKRAVVLDRLSAFNPDHIRGDNLYRPVHVTFDLELREAVIYSLAVVGRAGTDEW